MRRGIAAKFLLHLLFTFAKTPPRQDISGSVEGIAGQDLINMQLVDGEEE
jgi:hypothetical protein